MADIVNPELQKLQDDVRSLNNDLQGQLHHEIDLSEQIVDHKLLLDDSFQTLEDLSSKYVVQLADNRVLEKELSSCKKTSRKDESIQADLRVDTNRKSVQVDLDLDVDCKITQENTDRKITQENLNKPIVTSNLSIYEKVLQLDVLNLKEQIAIEKRFRNIEYAESCQKIQELLELNGVLKSSLREAKQKQKWFKVESVQRGEKGTQTETRDKDVVSELENIKETATKMKKHYDEVVEENKKLTSELDEEKTERIETVQEMMSKNHILGRKNTKLLREIEDIKLRKYKEADIDLTEELRFSRLDFGQDIKAVMNQMHKLLIENRILRAQVRGSDTSTQGFADFLNLKAEMFKELHEIRGVNNTEYEKLKRQYDDILEERKNLLSEVVEQKEQLVEECNKISNIKDEQKKFEVESACWQKLAMKHQRQHAKAAKSNCKLRKEISRLNYKMRLLDNYICKLHATQVRNENFEEDLKQFQEVAVAANTALLGNENDRRRHCEEIRDLKIQLKNQVNENYSVRKDLESTREKYTASLESNKEFTEKVTKEKEEADKLREFIVQQNFTLNSIREQNEKLQMQIAALELNGKKLSRNPAEFLDFPKESRSNSEWGTPRCYQEAGDSRYA